MTNYRIATFTCCLAAACALVQAQIAPPAPPAAPTPMAAPPALAPLPPLPPAAAATPMAAPRPMPVPRAFDLVGGDIDLNLDFQFNIDREEIEQQVEAARAMADQYRNSAEVQEQMQAARAMADQVRAEARAETRIAMAAPFAFAQQNGIGVASAPFPAKVRTIGGSEDSLYQRGQGALDGKRWDEAAEMFSQAIAKNGPRADGALYWKAYALKKLNKNSEALASLAELRKTYPNSRWMDDAKALELDLGKPVTPEAESDEELKLLALNGIMQSDPDRAIPLVENQLKSSASPRVKKNALFVLAQSNNPKAQAVIERIARGGANPDLQVKAVTYISERRRPGASQLLMEIYGSSNDMQVKRAVLQSLASIGRDRNNPSAGNADLWQIYDKETTVEGKEQILQHMWDNANTDKLLGVIRNEKEMRLRRMALQILASQKGQQSGESLVQIYNSESDPAMKNSILDSLSGQRNAVALIAMAKAEKDHNMKLRIVERISNMAPKSKEAQTYLEELLK